MRVPFVFGSLASTFCAFTVAFVIGWRAAAPGDSDDSRSRRRLRQYRLYGTGACAVDLGQQAAAPVALIFCFDNIFLFSLVPLLMSFSGPRG